MSNEQQVKRRLAAIMFSDICGYSKLMHEDEAAALEMVRLHNRLADKAIAECDGNLIKRLGDGLLIEFPSAVLAVECAMLMQYSLQEYNAEAEPRYQFKIRIGVHLGDVVVSEGDIHGDGVNVASRIEPLAPPGGICISQDVYNMVHNKVELQFVSIGSQQLKNIKRQIEIYRVLVAAADAERMDAVTPITSVIAVGKKKYRWLWITGVVLVSLIIVGSALKAMKRHNRAQMLNRAVETGRMVPAVEPAGQGVIRLTPEKAVLHGNLRKNYFGIGNWFDGDAFWENVEITPGKYKVFITYSVGDIFAGGAFIMNVGDTVIKGTAENTGGWDRPKTFELGEVTITQKLLTLKVSASTPRKKQLMALRKVELRKLD